MAMAARAFGRKFLKNAVLNNVRLTGFKTAFLGMTWRNE
jgi:hydrogenase/urease accessory protein HupE